MHLTDWAAFVALGLLWGINFLFMREAVHVVQPLQAALGQRELAGRL